MNNDILPPRRPERPPELPQTPTQPAVGGTTSEDLPSLDLAEKPAKKPFLSKKIWVGAAIIGAFVIVAIIAIMVWYLSALRPVSSQDDTLTRVRIITGSSPSQIGQQLHESKVIRSPLAFDIYTRLTRTRSQLQAGTYRLSPAQSTGDIVTSLTSGKVDNFTITFFPGATLRDTSDTPRTKKTDVETVLLNAGYRKAEIEAALAKSYDSPLFAHKPSSADLEGYVYGETYQFDSSSTVEDVLQRTFDEYYTQLTKHNIINGLKKQGLTLYQGITLASIIQREVPDPADQQKVAQIFLKRRKIGMPLGSDVTYQYAAQKLGVAPSPDLDSPYNTRRFKGLPPGPIAVPGLSALEAAAQPASTDYLYFLSGDDDKTYFSRTNEEHEANIVHHCAQKCSTF